MGNANNNAVASRALPKCPTGIRGLDEITLGGLPRGRPTLLCGGAGSGKTLLATTFLVNGAEHFGEPGVLMTFEESSDELASDVASLGFDLQKMAEERKIFVDYVRIERSEIEETGEYDLEGLFVRLDHARKQIGARRVVLDTIESLFSGLSNASILRAELRRLFRWLKEKELTAVVTAERGDGMLTRQGLEEYVSDAVILLDHRVHEQVSTRRLRIVKYRGSTHGTNEYPFLIDASGISVLPVTSLGLNHKVVGGRISSGITELDNMLGGEGFHRGSTVLVSGTAGTGKSSLAAHFADAACARGERCLVFLFEESPDQHMRNMRSIGVDMQQWVDKGLLRFYAERPSSVGLETHLGQMYRRVEEFRPSVVILEPITNLLNIGTTHDIRGMLTRIIDHLKSNGVTGLFTSLTPNKSELQETQTGISSLVDTWIILTTEEVAHERQRRICVLKSRGMSHSNDIRRFTFTDNGLRVSDSIHDTAGQYAGGG